MKLVKMEMQSPAAAFSLLVIIHVLCVVLLVLAGNHQLLTAAANEFNRHDFPPGFVFGSSTSAYQVEGAAFEDGRKASIFDSFAHSGFLNGNGDVTADEYHRYKEDVQLMAETGLDAYRFSISWSRLLPDGRGSVNLKGLEYYNNLINELKSNGIQPHATLMHYDVPQALEDEYQGFLNPRIIEDFTAYADVCFKEFGDRVLHWSTINEANIFMLGGYNNGITPPSRCSPNFGPNCTLGNSTTEPYVAAHNLLLAHASAARLYKRKYQATQKGSLGFSIYAYHFIPYLNTSKDTAAARRAYDFFIGWFMHPLMYGDYPKIMKKNVGTRLPTFSEKESELVKGSFDFIGINYYSVVMIKDSPESLTTELRDLIGDMAVSWIPLNDSVPIGMNPFANAPWGLQRALDYFKQVYDNPPIYIYENGQLSFRNTSVEDLPRMEYLRDHISALLDSVRNGSNTKGYFVWSFVDLFELLCGYKCSLGLYYIDHSDPQLTRLPKLSQQWYSGFLKGKNIVVDEAIEDILTNYPMSVVDVDELDLLKHVELVQQI